MDLVSIILPVYNSEKYIKLAMESVLKQSYKNFELIIVNDGSTDNSDNICKEYQQKDERIKYIYTQNNGVSSARNYALKYATGTYITFIDDDDMYEKDYLKELVNNVNKYNTDLVSCAYKTINKKNRIINYSSDLTTSNLKEYIEILQPNLLINQLWNKIYKLDIIKKNNITFDTNIDLGEDYKFNLEYFSYINSQIYINKPLYNYRINDNGLGFKYRKNSNEIKLSLLRKLELLYNNNNYELNYIYKNYIIQYFSYFSNIVDKRNNITKKEKLIEIRNLIQKEDYRSKLKEINENSNIKYKLICNIMLLEKKYILYLLGILANKYDKLQKIKKL